VDLSGQEKADATGLSGSKAKEKAVKLSGVKVSQDEASIDSKAEAKTGKAKVFGAEIRTGGRAEDVFTRTTDNTGLESEVSDTKAET